MKRFINVGLIMLLLTVALMLVSCGEDGGDTVYQTDGGSPQTNVSQQTQVGVSEDDISFGLFQQTSPEFEDDLNLSVEGEPDLGSEPATGNVVEDSVGPMYVERDGFTYLMDPATLEPVGDPIGVAVGEAEEPEVDEEVPADMPSAEEPTEDTKYPNTGMFLEDD